MQLHFAVAERQPIMEHIAVILSLYNQRTGNNSEIWLIHKRTQAVHQPSASDRNYLGTEKQNWVHKLLTQSVKKSVRL